MHFSISLLSYLNHSSPFFWNLSLAPIYYKMFMLCFCFMLCFFQFRFEAYWTQIMIEVTALLKRGTVFLAGETLQCEITFKNAGQYVHVIKNH